MVSQVPTRVPGRVTPGIPLIAAATAGSNITLSAISRFTRQTGPDAGSGWSGIPQRVAESIWRRRSSSDSHLRQQQALQSVRLNNKSGADSAAAYCRAKSFCPSGTLWYTARRPLARHIVGKTTTESRTDISMGNSRRSRSSPRSVYQVGAYCDLRYGQKPAPDRYRGGKESCCRLSFWPVRLWALGMDSSI